MMDVLDKYSGKVATRVAMPDASATEKAIKAAVKAAEPMKNFRPWARQAVLQHCANRFEERKDELAMALCIEAGKPIKDSAGEVTRLIETFRIAAEEAVRVNGETLIWNLPRAWMVITVTPSACRSGRCRLLHPSTFR
jgi:acyl-CoA reductase-like NAD-dependent aldehyde dehydrogenase